MGNEVKETQSPSGEWRVVAGSRGLEPEFLREVAERLHYLGKDLEDFRILPGDGGIAFLPRPGTSAGDLEAALEALISSLRAGYIPRLPRITFDRRKAGFQDHGDVYRALVESGEIRPLGQGRVSLGGRPLRLLEALDRKFLGIAGALGAREEDYPALISTDLLKRCGYFSSFPQYLTFACHLREDLSTLRAFVARLEEERALSVESFDCMGSPDHVLSPTVCFHTYEHLQDRALPPDGGPPVTARSRCFRYEAARLKSLERLWDFSMREIVFFGPPERVRAGLDEVRRRTEALVDELGLSAWIENANDAFFIDDFAKKASFQNAFDLKHELRLSLSDGSLAAGSFNFHNDFFAKAFGIAREGGGPLVSGCVGYGLERFALAVLVQKGINPEGWPETLRSGR